jgi:hypothetical protein
MLIYEKTWREYFFFHNDVGHPLIKEKVDNIKYLWDSKSFTKNTAIQAIGNWVGNTIRYEIIDDRSGQPNIIAHEHTGYCGETQKLVAAAYRTSLIPINGVMNYAEDHVWCEFYERDWYHIDGAVNNPYMYTDGWGKDMSSIWAWNGDGSIYEVTSKYLHPKDRIKVEFNIYDGFNNPMDGAIVTVFVEGLKDITWYKNYFSDILNEIFDKIPDILKGIILQRIFNRLQEKIDGFEEVIETYQISIWNYTDINGKCTFELGKNDEYTFLIQKPNIRYPWPISKHNRVKIMKNPQNISYDLHFNDFSNKIPVNNNLGDIKGNYQCYLKLNLTSYQLQRNIITKDIGTYAFPGIIDFFIVDEENFDLYKKGKKFNSFSYQKIHDSKINFSLNDKNYYLVFRNNAHMTNVIIDYELHIESSEDISRIEIVNPSTDFFEKPIYNIGTTININGVGTSDSLELKINNETEIITTINNKWFYNWNTTNLAPGFYLINVTNEDGFDNIYVKLIDTIPPSNEIINPNNLDVFENDNVIIIGRASDNYQLDRIELIINENSQIVLDNLDEWSYNLDIKNLNPGEHLIKVITYDKIGLSCYKDIKIIKNDSENEWNPIINSFFIKPEKPTNISNIFIFSNITTDSPFSIKKVIICYENGTECIKQKMFRYGDFPPQDRHKEDNIQDIPNDPIYGFELGKFQTGEVISCWIETYDTANNKKISSTITFEIK